MAFDITVPLGKPIVALALLSLVAGTAVLLRSRRPTAEQTVWSFTPADAAADRALAGPGVAVDLVAAPAIDVRLSSLFMAGLTPAAGAVGRPDVVELEVNAVGKFLRGSAADAGFRPLGDELHRGGWDRRIAAGPLAAYSIGGEPFGVPIAVHPAVLLYRRDLIDLSGDETWAAVQADCLRYERSHGNRWAMGLPSASADVLLVLLQQRRVTVVDADGTPHLTDPKVAETVCWYARAAGGPGRIGTDVNPSPGGAAADLAEGDVAALVVADWAVADVVRDAPQLAGRLAVRPLPRFEAGDARTATWGGTMAGIPRFCPDPEAAWRLVERLYLSPTAVARRWEMGRSIPPLPAAWGDPMFHQPDPFFGGQRVAELYVTLAGELPPRVVTPYTTTAANLLAYVLDRAVSRARGGDDQLEPFVRGLLAGRQAQLQRLIDFDRGGGR